MYFEAKSHILLYHSSTEHYVISPFSYQDSCFLSNMPFCHLQALQVYSDGVESGALPSITQRPLSFTPGLTAQPVWGGRQVPDISKEEKESIMSNIVDKGTC